MHLVKLSMIKEPLIDLIYRDFQTLSFVELLLVLKFNEIQCRGDPMNYHTTLQLQIDKIGKAQNPARVNYVFDQFDYYRNILLNFNTLHPGVIAQNPDNRCFLKAVSYRLHDSGPHIDLIKILKRVIATPDTDYVETIDLLRVALGAVAQRAKDKKLL